MNRLLILTIIFLISIGAVFGQSSSLPNSPLTSGPAPAFTAKSTKGDIHFPADYFGKWKIIFSHPADFTPVCSSEILALADIQADFKKANAVLLVISTDGLNSHLAWEQSLEGISREGKAQVDIDFPIISDADLSISRNYGILHKDTGKIEDIRSVIFVDPENNIQAMFFYPDYVGRNIPEIYRTLLALQMHDRREVMTPANWQPGDAVLLPSPPSIKDSDKMAEKNDPDQFRLAWYMWYRKY